MNEQSPWEKRFQRERASRKAAEKLLEEKSMELYQLNQSLESQVHQRTKELEEALKEAEAAQAAKDIFLASMSHELRTPLNAIIGFSQILSRLPNVPKNILSFVEKINISGNSLLQLINTILNFAKIEADQISIHLEKIKVEQLVKEIQTLTEPQAKQKNLTVRFNTQIESFNADKQLISQVLLNLVSNAIKFSHNDNFVEVTIGQVDDKTLFHVCDYGIGMTEEHIKSLFKPFSQIQESKTCNINGTGLGLYITKKIVARHHGSIEVTSKLGRGSCFTVTL